MNSFVEGRRCLKCGTTQRYKSLGCVECDKQRKRNLTPEKRKEMSARRAKWIVENRERHLATRKKWYRLKEYGLTPERLAEMLTSQNSTCACCETELFGGGETHVDHNHITGKVRGLLCMPCNLAIGMVKENIDTVLKLGIYLEKHRG